MAAAPSDDRRYWVGFQRVPFIGPTRIERLVQRFGSLADAWHAPTPALRAVLDERAVASLLKTRAELSLETEMERLDRLGIGVVTRGDPDYPYRLAQIAAPPPVLYLRGALSRDDDVAVAIVGTRRATAYGREVAARLAADLASAGVTVVSGLARGIDGAAHAAALRAGGRTIAVLGSGPDIVYPAEHRHLAAQITEQGALVADYPPGKKPDAQNFPARNRLISGLCRGVVVVEAPERSGALITADFAADQGRDVFVVPGSILSAASAGCHRLLRDGARAVTSAADVLTDLGLVDLSSAPAVQQPLPLGDGERRVLALLTTEPQHVDELAAAGNLPISDLSGLLATMELAGQVRNVGAQHYIRS